MVGKPALPQSDVENGWLAVVGILLTTLYASSEAAAKAVLVTLIAS